MDQPGTTFRDWMLILVMLTAAAGLRFYQIGGECLWFDELWHAELSTGRGSAHLRLALNEWIDRVPNLLSLHEAPPFTSIWRNMDWVIHPPLYHTVLRGWRSVWGDSVDAWRGLSAVCSLGCLPLIYFAARRAHGRDTAMIAVLVATISASQIVQARDTRGYSLAMLLTLLVGVFIVRIGDARRAWPWALAAGVGCLALPFIHYFAAAVVAGFAVFAATHLRGSRRRWLLSAIGLALVVFVAAWAPTIREQLACVEETADLFLAESGRGHLLLVAERAVSLPARLIADVDSASVMTRSALIGVGAALWAGMVMVAVRRPMQCVWLFPLAAITVLLAGLDAARSTRHLAFTRYAFAGSPAVFVLAPAIGSVCFRGSAGRRACWLVIVGMGVLTVPWGYLDTPDFRPMASHLRERLGDDEPIILASPNPRGRDGQTLYLYCAYYGGAFPRDLIIATRPLTPETTGRFAGRTGWVVAANPATDPIRVVPGSTEVARWVPADGAIGACFRVRFPAASPPEARHQD